MHVPHGWLPLHLKDGVEDRERFLLRYLSFEVQRQSVLAGILPPLQPLGFANISNEILVQLLLYGDKNFPNEVNRKILELTFQYIHETGRLE